MRPVPNLKTVNKGIMKLLSAFLIWFKTGGLDEKKVLKRGGKKLSRLSGREHPYHRRAVRPGDLDVLFIDNVP